jgi:hypothetical protein
MRIERRCERRASRISCSRGQIPRKLGCCCRQASVSAAWLPLHTATLTWFDIVHINPSPLLQHTALQMSTALTVMECNDKCERNKQRSRLTTSAVEPSTSTPAPQHYSTPLYRMRRGGPREAGPCPGVRFRGLCCRSLAVLTNGSLD